MSESRKEVREMYYGEIDKWIAGYKVRGFEWIDNKNYYLHIEQYSPGASLSRSPVMERSVLIPLDEWESMKQFIHSIVTGVMR